MIHIDRDSIPAPKILLTRGRKEIEHAHQFYSDDLEGRRQRRFPFKVYRDDSVRETLMQLFHGKCAYCESKIGKTQPPDIEQFRPKSGVVGESGEHYPDHYYWLANEWTNLYITCIDCNRVRYHKVEGEKVRSGKGNRFPLENESLRAELRASLEQLTEERPLLLDPCGDDPEDHLVFNDLGGVVSETQRGRVTIDVLGLNRPHLVEARREAALRNRSLLGRLQVERFGRSLSRELDEVAALMRPEQEYAALHRSLIRQAGIDELLQRESPEAPRKQRKPRPSKARRKQVEKEYEQFVQSQDDFSLEVEADRKKYFSKSRQVERIEIRNLKSIQRMDLDLARTGSGTSWTMLLGQNGTGKSTVLQAISLALSGAAYFGRLVDELGIDTAGFVRDGCKSGTVKVFLGPKPHTLRFRPDRVEFVSATGKRAAIHRNRKPSKAAQGTWGVQVLMLSYGATRLLPRALELRRQRRPSSEFAKSENLFDPFVPLLDARTWLLQLPDDRFDYTARALKSLLSLDEDDTFVREKDNVYLRMHRARVPLERLSDGYQSVVALTADILEVVLGLWASPDLAEGVVLLDEIGAHMHPTWKMRIVGALREFLPRIQFIATTHDPLCLRGLSNSEVVVMRRDTKGRAVAITDLPSVEGLRVDQLLTSEYFGLESTVDPAYQRLFDEYYALRRKSRPTKKDKARIKVLRTSLDELGMMGRTRRERLMLNAIDAHLATEAGNLDASARAEGEARLQLNLTDILEKLEGA